MVERKCVDDTHVDLSAGLVVAIVEKTSWACGAGAFLAKCRSILGYTRPKNPSPLLNYLDIFRAPTSPEADLKRSRDAHGHRQGHLVRLPPHGGAISLQFMLRS